MLFIVLFLTLFLFACAWYSKPHEKNSQKTRPLSGLNIINHGGYAVSSPFDSVTYTIDGKKAASHGFDDSFEKMIPLPPGDHFLTVDHGKSFKCKFRFTVDEGYIETFNNYNYYTFVMNQADKATHAETPALGSWGFSGVNTAVLERKVEDMDCHSVKNDAGRKICEQYYDNLCR